MDWSTVWVIFVRLQKPRTGAFKKGQQFYVDTIKRPSSFGNGNPATIHTQGGQCYHWIIRNNHKETFPVISVEADQRRWQRAVKLFYNVCSIIFLNTVSKLHKCVNSLSLYIYISFLMILGRLEYRIKCRHCSKDEVQPKKECWWCVSFGLLLIGLIFFLCFWFQACKHNRSIILYALQTIIKGIGWDCQGGGWRCDESSFFFFHIYIFSL